MMEPRRFHRFFSTAAVFAVLAVCFGGGGGTGKLNTRATATKGWPNQTSTKADIFTTSSNWPGTTQAEDTSQDCSAVHQQNASSKCHFVQVTDDCHNDGGLVNYIIFAYCCFGDRLVPLAVVILFFWWLFLFVLLAIAADEFFCPSLVVIAKTLRLSDNIAGVTLLAFGNGAPDVFSAIAAVGAAKNGDAGLAFGALLGAGVFVTTVVAGAVSTVRPFHLMERPFLRDVIFYIAAVFMTFVYLYRGHIYTGEAVGFIVMYVVYVAVVVVGRAVYQRQKRAAQLQTVVNSIQEPAEENPEDDPEDPHIPQIPKHHHDHSDDEESPLIDSVGVDDELPWWKEFLRGVSPIDTEEWRFKSCISKTYQIIQAVPHVLLKLTTPVVDYEEEEKHNWNKPLNLFHCIISPIFALFAASPSAALYKIGGTLPVCVVVLIVGIALAVLVFFTSRRDQYPVYHWVFAYIGFAVALIWIEAVANEIVNILQTLGVVLSLSSAVLGLTLLAWGNSLGDLVADTVMARQGYPRTGISACFAGPMFNLLMGVGIPFTIRCVKNGGSQQIKFTLIQVVLVAGLLFSLVSSLVIMLFTKFMMRRSYGIYLFVLYAVFLLIALLVETNVITGKV